MDAMMVTLPSSLRVEVGDRVTLIGRDGAERVGIEDLARAAGTIGYEVACGLRARPERVRRVVEDHGG
jgi:alanine racemase